MIILSVSNVFNIATLLTLSFVIIVLSLLVVFSFKCITAQNKELLNTNLLLTAALTDDETRRKFLESSLREQEQTEQADNDGEYNEMKIENNDNEFIIQDKSFADNDTTTLPKNFKGD